MEEPRRKRGIRWRKDAVLLMRSAAVNVMHPLVHRQNWSIAPKLPHFSAAPSALKCILTSRGEASAEKRRTNGRNSVEKCCSFRVGRGYAAANLTSGFEGFSAFSQCSTMDCHVEGSGVGEGEEKERSKFGGEMM